MRPLRALGYAVALGLALGFAGAVVDLLALGGLGLDPHLTAIGLLFGVAYGGYRGWRRPVAVAPT